LETAARGRRILLVVQVHRMANPHARHKGMTEGGRGRRLRFSFWRAGTMSALVAALACLLVLKTVSAVLLTFPDYFPPNFRSDFLLGRRALFLWGLSVGVLRPRCRRSVCPALGTRALERGVSAAVFSVAPATGARPRRVCAAGRGAERVMVGPVRGFGHRGCCGIRGACARDRGVCGDGMADRSSAPF
jgi:hypothetical protein